MDLEEIKPLILLFISGFLIRYCLIYAGQAWAKSYAQTVTFVLLPIITYVITKTISGNLALSLGMIGALSIVRFRHPVKSALELVVYFDLITLGISASVRTKWAIQLLLCTIFIILFIKVIQILFKKFGKSFYKTSFNEGSSVHNLEVVLNKKNDFIEKSEFLINSFENIEEKKFIYRLVFENKKSLLKFKNEIENDQHLLNINLNFN